MKYLLFFTFLFLSCLYVIRVPVNAIGVSTLEQFRIDTPSLSGHATARIIVKFNNRNNKLVADTSGPRSLNLIMLEPMNGMDFRYNKSLFLRVVKDKDTVINKSISEFIQPQQKKKRKSAVINEFYTDFQKLEISVYDKSKRIKYVVDALVFVK